MSTDKPRICDRAELRRISDFTEDKQTCQYCAHEHSDSKSFPCNQCCSNYISQFKPKPRFTEDEVATMRVLAGTGYVVLARDESGCMCAFASKPIWAEKEWIVSPENDGARWDTLPRELFAFLLPGQSVTIADIIGK